MAKFNPDVRPSQDPNYLGYSRGISVPDTIKPTGQAANDILPKGAVFEGPKYEGIKHVDETGLYQGQAELYKGKAAGAQAEAEGYKARAEGIRLAGAGEQISDIAKVADLAAKGVDAYYKDSIHNQVYDSASAIRDEYLDSLQKAVKAVKTGKGSVTAGGETVSPETANAALDVITTDGQSVPDDIGKLPHALGGLESAKANGKISPTDYLGRLNAMAKSYRARYPGYKDLIDSEVSKVTGVNPANAQIKSLLSDINSYASAKAGTDHTKQDRAWLLANAEQHPDGIAILKAFDNKQIDFYSASAKIMPVMNAKVQMEHDARVAAGADRDKKRQGEDAGTIITTYGNALSSASIDAIRLNTGLDTEEKFTDFAARVAKGVDVDSVQWPTIAATVQNSKDTMVAGARREIYKPLDKNGNSLATMYGPEATEKALERMGAHHDELLKAIGMKDPGLSMLALNTAKAQGTDAVKQIMKSPQGGAFRLMQGFAQISPDVASAMAISVLSNELLPQVDKDALVTQLAQLMRQPSLYVTDRNGAVVSPDKGASSTPIGVPNTVSDAIDTAVEQNASPERIKQLIQAPTQIFNPNLKDDNVKRNLIRATFDPANSGLVAKFELDLVKAGKLAPGQQSIYKSLVNDKMSAEVKRLSASEPELWEMYKTFAKDELANGPLKADIKSIADIKLPPGYHMSWNSETHNLTVRDPRGRDCSS